MKYSSNNLIHIEHIMWQPFFKCVVDCKGCYISNSLHSKYLGELNSEIVDLIFVDEKVICDQFTISLDTCNEYNKKLIEELKYIWNIYSQVPKKDTPRLNEKLLPDLCITCFNYETVLTWARALSFTEEEFIQPLKILSLSNLPNNIDKVNQLKKVIKQTETILCWNKVVDKVIPFDYLNNNMDIPTFTHFVFKKEALGHSQKYENYINYLKTIKNAIKTNKKFYEDSCIKDSRLDLKIERTCGAGISKIHIWPNGAVSGCPYDSHFVAEGEIKLNRQNVWLEIKRATFNPCCFKYCQIYKLYQQFKKNFLR